jgi:hypothetical protein
MHKVRSSTAHREMQLSPDSDCMWESHLGLSLCPVPSQEIAIGLCFHATAARALFEIPTRHDNAPRSY